MKYSTGVAPAVAALAVIAAVSIGVGGPVALANMQHRGTTKFTPIDAPYVIMRAGEAMMGAFQTDRGKWNGELIRIREMERVELQKRCPDCAQQIQNLEQEQVRIRQREESRVRTGTQSGAGAQAGQGQSGR